MALAHEAGEQVTVAGCAAGSYSQEQIKVPRTGTQPDDSYCEKRWLHC